MKLLPFGRSASPEVKVLNQNGELINFLAYGAKFRGAVNLAVDLDNDGVAEIITALAAAAGRNSDLMPRTAFNAWFLPKPRIIVVV